MSQISNLVAGLCPADTVLKIYVPLDGIRRGYEIEILRRFQQRTDSEMRRQIGIGQISIRKCRRNKEPLAKFVSTANDGERT